MEHIQRIVLGQLKASSTQLYEVPSTPSQPAISHTVVLIIKKVLQNSNQCICKINTANSKQITLKQPWPYSGTLALSHLSIKWLIPFLRHLPILLTSNWILTFSLSSSPLFPFFGFLFMLTGSNVGETDNQLELAKPTFILLLTHKQSHCKLKCNVRTHSSTLPIFTHTPKFNCYGHHSSQIP